MSFIGSVMRTGAAVGAVTAASLGFTMGSAATAWAQETTITAVLHSDLRVLDPILTTAYMSRNHGYMIFDTLFAMDENVQVQPQMVDSWETSEDGLTYTFTLREGLKFHDGSPVTSEDVVASLERWGERDGMGQKLMSFTETLEAVDDGTFRLVLREPYGLVLESLAKPSSNVPFIMPKRLAETPSDQPIPEQIGSGPFKWVPEEFQPGVKAVYVKNEDYVPRDEPPSWAAGGKVVKVDRVEWVKMPDHMTAVNALMNGEIDYIEQPPIDLLPILESGDGIAIENFNLLGFQSIIRPNFLHPPFDDQKIRQALAYAINQEDFMAAMIGDPEYYELCGAMFVCGTPLATDAGSEPVMTSDVDRARQLLQEAGYDNTPVVLMHPTDVATLSTQPTVAADLLRRAGFNVDLQAMDWQTLVSRRASQEPPANGGWNLFITNWVGADILNPIANAPLIASGREGGWFGWPENQEIEALRDQFARTRDPAEQKRLAEEIQKLAYDYVMYAPIGQYYTMTAYRDNLTGLLAGPAPFFWNVEKN